MTQSGEGLKTFTHLLETIADNKYVFGDKLVEIGFSGPNLEATLAAVAMAQGELGHARLLYNWVFDLKGYKGKKPDIKSQTGKAFQRVTGIYNWISLIASFYAVNTAVDLVLKSILEANHLKVAGRVQKLLREQKEHIMYSRGWANELLNDRGAVPKKFKEELNQVIPQVETWLQSIERKTELVQEGYIIPQSNLLHKFKEELKSLTAGEERSVGSV